MPKILNDDRDAMKRALGIKLRSMKKDSPEELAQVLSQMSDEEANSILHDFEIWARDSQWIDLSMKAPTTVIVSGRG